MCCFWVDICPKFDDDNLLLLRFSSFGPRKGDHGFIGIPEPSVLLPLPGVHVAVRYLLLLLQHPLPSSTRRRNQVILKTRPKVKNIGLQIFVTCIVYRFVTFDQYFLVGQAFCKHFEPIYRRVLIKQAKLGLCTNI
jgi:hypothetical protein